MKSRQNNILSSSSNKIEIYMTVVINRSILKISGKFFKGDKCSTIIYLIWT